jgi:hypothetical protein
VTTAAQGQPIVAQEIAALSAITVIAEIFARRPIACRSRQSRSDGP